MCELISGREDICNSNIGGLKNVYLFNYVNYRNYQIEVENSVLISYPLTPVYQYELRADANTFNTVLDDADDGVSYNQSANLTLKKLQFNAQEINHLLNKRIGCIVESRLGYYQIMGLYNGVTVKSVKSNSGGGYTDISGYVISLTAKEKNAPFFIENLSDAGFEVFDPTSEYLLRENGSYLLQENGFKIKL